MAQSIDRQGLDTLFVKARSLRKWVAGAEMVKVREGVCGHGLGTFVTGPAAVRPPPMGAHDAEIRAEIRSAIGADGRRRLRYSDGAHGPSLEWEGVIR